MVIIATAAAGLDPEFANMVIRTCSFKLKDPGFIENDHFVLGIRINLFSKIASISLPIGSAAI